MRKISYYLLLLLLLEVGCDSQSGEKDILPDAKTTLKMVIQQSYHVRTVDEDNPASEQIIQNVSIFLTEPSTAEIVQKYVYTAFSFSGDNGVVTLSAEPSELLAKDIYVIANYDNEDDLNALQTLDNMRDLLTPEVDENNVLDPLDGFCMFGSTLNFDFTNETGNSATIELERSCAKFRVNLTFPENPILSSDNSFLIQTVAKYTYVVENPTALLPLTDYFDFVNPIVLVNNGGNSYINTAYLYEGANRPTIILYTHINNSTEPQEFTATLPIPRRNYFYDLWIQVYESTESVARSVGKDNDQKYDYRTILKVYDDKGELVNDNSTIH